MVANRRRAALMLAQTENRTRIAVRSAQHEGQMLISRAEAKRMLQQFGRVKEVVLDFDGVADIGPAFADELFRVYAAAHPHIRITPINTVPAVARMVRRALAAGGAQNRQNKKS